MPSKPTEGHREIGRIDKFFNGIAQVRGLPHVFVHETLVTEEGEPCAIVIGFDADRVEALFFDEQFDVSRPIFRSGHAFAIPVSDAHVGRVIDGLGNSRDELPAVPGKSRPVFVPAPTIIDRDPVSRPLITGIKMVDAILPLGRGQRELIIGDHRVGKSTIAEDAVIHQRNATEPVYCVYVLCSHKFTRLSELVSLFRDSGAMTHTTLVAASADDSYAAQYLAPFVGCAIGEHFRDTGRDALVIYDDLSKHAKTYRDISLLLERTPGREAYPADIFSLHAGLLERAAQLSRAKGGGSLTALPIVETEEGDLTSYIPTNIISITDGQIYMERGLRERGFNPAINAGLSVSRLGGQVQPGPLKEAAAGLRLALSQQRELLKLTQLETALSAEAQQRLRRGELILELLKQEKHRTLAWTEQVVLLQAIEGGYFDDFPKDQWQKFESLFVDVLRNEYDPLLAEIARGTVGPPVIQEIGEAITAFKGRFLKEA